MRNPLTGGGIRGSIESVTRTRREIAGAHANRAYFCSCGKVVHGNGGRSNHREMHERRSDGHRFVTRETYLARLTS